MEAQEVEFDAEGVTLRGPFYGAESSGRSGPAAVMTHGLAGRITLPPTSPKVWRTQESARCWTTIAPGDQPVGRPRPGAGAIDRRVKAGVAHSHHHETGRRLTAPATTADAIVNRANTSGCIGCVPSQRLSRRLAREVVPHLRNGECGGVRVQRWLKSLRRLALPDGLECVAQCPERQSEQGMSLVEFACQGRWPEILRRPAR